MFEKSTFAWAVIIRDNIELNGHTTDTFVAALLFQNNTDQTPTN